jgi:hypothetical protein
MTPTEKANELVNKYLNASFNCKGCNMPFCDAPCTQLSLHEAKECALIAVEEIIFKETMHAYTVDYIQYWQQVKKAITEIKP